MNRQALRPGLHADQVKLIARADKSADVAERHVRTVWDRLIAIIEAGGSWCGIYGAVRAALHELRQVPRILSSDLDDVAKHAHAVTAEHLAEKLPARQRELLGARVAIQPRPLLEDEAVSVSFVVGELFPALTPAETFRLVYSSGWFERLEALTTLAAPDSIAAQIANGVLLGRTPAQIARDIRPLLANVQVSARRVARTESVRIAHDVQMEMYEQIPGVRGYQIHSMHTRATRHWHSRRDKTIYYRFPGPGQKGFYQMPRPPREADDPGERPAGAPQVAANCLCWLTPVIA